MSHTSSEVAQTHSGPAGDEDDQFERDLKEMLKDGPSLSDLSSTVQGGAGHGAGPHTVPRAAPSTYAAGTGSMPRSQTVPPGTSPEQTVTSNIPLSSPERNGGYSGSTSPSSAPSIQLGANSKIDTIKAWSINTYKCTRQMISERFGKCTRTVDLELEAQIEALRDTQKKYANILRLARALTNHFYHVVQTQRAMGDAFSELSQKSPELQDEFSYNSETQKTLSKNGETLLGALNFFTSSVNTLCNKTMEDTLMTIRQYETSRIEFDAYRTDFETMQNGPRDSTTIAKMEEAQRKYAAHKEKFDKLRADVSIKLKFLEENKVKVMHKQLLLFHNAIAAYFSGNQSSLESTLAQFNIKLKAPNSDKTSWLEQ